MPGRWTLEDYEQVEDRLKRFWADHPDGAIITELAGATADQKSVIIRAEVWFDRNADAHPAGVGIAQETQGGGGANSNCWVENCDTSAVGRALANCGYSGDKRASRQEMAKANRGYEAPTPREFPSQRRGNTFHAPSADGEIKPCWKCSGLVRFGAGEGGKTERYNADGSQHFRSCGKGATGYEPDEPDPFAEDASYGVPAE